MRVRYVGDYLDGYLTLVTLLDLCLHYLITPLNLCLHYLTYGVLNHALKATIPELHTVILGGNSGAGKT